MLGSGVAAFALIALGSPPLKYQDGVQAAQAWFLNSTPAGARLLSITDPTLNGSFGTHQERYDPQAAASPVIASYAALDLGTSYLAVTNLQANGSTFAENYPWWTFNSTTLSGALLVYSNQDVRVYCLLVFCS